MPYEQRDNSGSIFKNERKEKDTHPDRTGTAMIDGKMYWVSGWLKEDRNGNPFLSLAFKPKEEVADRRPPARQAISQRAAAKPPLKQDMDDEIPW